MAHRPLDPEFVLAHQGYVQELAQRLVFDGARADDLAQQVWLRLLEHPPRHAGALRGWLATVARNLALGERRSAERRQCREGESGRHEAEDAAADLVLREERRAELVREVLLLEPAMREAIVLRYFDGLSPRAIAARTGVPVATVKTRLKRGLASLRGRLDRNHGDRAAWSLTLLDGLSVQPSTAVLALHGAKVLGAGVLMMTTKKLAVIAALLAAAFLTWRVATDRPQPRTSEPAGIEAVASPDVATVPEGVDGKRTAARREPTRLTGLLPKKPAPVPKTGPGSLEVSVVRIPERTPVANVVVTLRSATNSPRSRAPLGVARTDARGIARFPLLEPGDLKVDCDRIGLGAPLAGAYAHVASGETRSVTLGIPNHIAVRGRVVDRAGRPVEGAEVCLTPQGAEFESHVVATTPADGSFELEPVQASAVYVHACKAGFAPSARVLDRTIPGKTFEVELVLAGPGASLSGTVRDARGEPVAGALVLAGPEEGTSWLGDNGDRHLLPGGSATRSDQAGHFEFLSLPPGPGELHIEADGFLGHDTTIALRAGETGDLDIVMRRGAIVAGFVRNSGSTPVSGVRVLVRALGTGVVREVEADGTGAFRIEGLPGGAARGWAADAAGTGWALEALDLREGEQTDWNPVLAKGGEIAGRVLDELGKPAAGLAVVVRCEASDGEPYSRGASTDKQGRFRVEGCREAAHDVKVFPRDSQLFALAELRGVRPSNEELSIQLDPAVRPSAIVRGKIIDPDGRPFAGATLTPSCRALDWQAGQLTQADGSFRTVPLPAGAWSFEIEADGFAPLVLPERNLAIGERLDLGTLRLSRGDVIVVQLTLAEGVSPSRVYATVRSEDGSISAWCKVEGDVARTPPLPPGRYRLAFEGSCAARVLDAVVRAGEETRLEVALDRGVGVRLRLERANAEPEARCTIRVRDERGVVLLERSPRRAHVGTYSISARFTPGSYLIEAEGTAGRRASVPLVVDSDRPGAVTDVVLR